MSTDQSAVLEWINDFELQVTIIGPFDKAPGVAVGVITEVEVFDIGQHIASGAEVLHILIDAKEVAEGFIEGNVDGSGFICEESKGDAAEWVKVFRDCADRIEQHCP